MKKQEENMPAVAAEPSPKDLAEIQNRAVALSQGPDEFGLQASDLRIATLLLMQPGSGLVNDQKAKLGDIIHNAGEKVIGGLDKPIEVIALYKFETVRMYSASDGGKFVKEMPYVGKVEKEGVETTPEGGTAVRRYHTLNYFVLLTDDIKSGEGLPVLLRFKSTSFDAGSKVGSFLYRKRFFGALPYDFALTLGVERRQNEKKQSWAQFGFSEKTRPTTDPEKQLAKQMIALINAKKYSVVEAAEETESSGSAPHPIDVARPVVVDSEVVGTPNGQY